MEARRDQRTRAAIEIVEQGPQWAAVVQSVVAMPGMREAQIEARHHLETVVGAAPSGPRFTLWRRLGPDEIDYAPGLMLDGPLPVSGLVSIITLPEGRTACLTMTGPFSDLGRNWGLLFEACDRRGLQRTGLNWEVYPRETGSPVVTRLYAALVSDAGRA